MTYVYRNPKVRLVMSLYDWFGYRLAKRKQPKIIHSPKHICLIALHQIGDVVLTLPTIAQIRTMFPNAKLTLIAGSGPTQLVTHNPWDVESISFDALWQKVVVSQKQALTSKSAVVESKRNFIQLIQKLAPDVAVVYHPDFIANQCLAKTAVPVTVGFANAGGGFWLTNPVDMPAHGHQMERNEVLITELRTLYDVPIPKLQPPVLTPGRSDQDHVISWLKQHHLSTKSFVVIHPFASCATKNWPAQNWAKLCQWLKTQNLATVMIGSRHDSLSVPSSVVTCLGDLSLPQTAALLSHARLFIGIDSGPAHIAAAVGCPLISIYSSVNDPKRWAPQGDPKQTLILHQPVTDRQRFPYELRDLPIGSEGNPYSDKITLDHVTQSIKELLSL